MIQTKGTKKILSFREVLFRLSKDYRNYIEGIESYNLNFSNFFENNKVLLEIHYYFLSLDKSKLIGKLWVSIDYLECIFSELDKEGYELDSAYEEFQDLIANHTEQLQ